MILIDIIIAFLLGIVFVQWFIPLVDGIINLFLTQLEVWKGRMVVKISESQKQAQKIKEEPDKEFSQIGFAVLQEEEDESDD